MFLHDIKNEVPFNNKTVNVQPFNNKTVNVQLPWYVPVCFDLHLFVAVDVRTRIEV
jgi:hypothetical protein